MMLLLCNPTWTGSASWPTTCTESVSILEAHSALPCPAPPCPDMPICKVLIPTTFTGASDSKSKIVRGQAEADEIYKDIIPLSFAGLDFSKINFGMAIYGRGYELAGEYRPELWPIPGLTH